MRRSLISTLAAAAVVATSLAIVPAAQATSGGPVPEPFFGMHVPTIANGTDPGVTYGSIRLWDSGVTWGQVEQRKGYYWWNGLDAAIGNANEQKVSTLYVLGGTPTWAASNKKQGTYPNKGAASVPKMKDWKNWVRAVTSRYAASIDSYQIWNEADLTNFWAGTPKQMADLTKAAAKIIRQNDPTATIVSASSTVRLKSSYNRFFPAYLKALKKANWPVDVIAAHTYPAGNGDPADRVGYIEQVKNDMRKAKVPANKPLWDTEVNYGIPGPGSIGGQSINGAQAASWVAQTYLDNLRLDVARSYWYFWSPATNRIGITLQDGTPGAVGYQTVNGWLAGSYYTCTDGTGTTPNTCQLGDNNNPEVIAWATTGSATYTVPAGVSVQCDALNNCQAVAPRLTSSDWKHASMVRYTGGSSRKSVVALIAAVSATGLVLTACNSAATNTTPTESATETESTVDPNGVPATMVGMHIEGVEGGYWASAPFGALRLWDNGTAWSQIELVKGEFKWDNIEDSLANAESKGLTDVMLVLGTTPEWAAKEVNPEDYPQPGAASAPKNLADWDEWVTEVVTRYKGRFSSYQIWNEANLINFYNGTPQEMADMTKRAYDIIKAIDPEALVIAPSPSLRLTKAFDRFYPEYLSAIAQLGWPVDVFAVHSYPAADGDPVARGALIKVAQAALTAAGAPDLPLWDTELNYGLAGPGPLPKQEITGARAAGFVVRTYIDDLRYEIDRSYWYIWSLRPYELLGVQAYAGSDGEQGFFALDNWVTGATYNGCSEEGNIVTCNFSRAGEPWIVAWAQTGEAEYITPENSTLVCDPLSNCQEAAGGSTITLTEIPVRVYLSS